MTRYGRGSSHRRAVATLAVVRVTVRSETMPVSWGPRAVERLKPICLIDWSPINRPATGSGLVRAESAAYNGELLWDLPPSVLVARIAFRSRSVVRGVNSLGRRFRLGLRID